MPLGEVDYYEYGIADSNGRVHRTGLTEAEARGWLDGGIEMGIGREAFSMIRRPLGEWEKVMQSTYGPAAEPR